MQPSLRVVDGIVPELTREFLQAQAHVESAHVWYENGHLHAHVVALDDHRIDPGRLIEACALVLGDNQAPQDIEIVCVRPKAG